LYGYNTDAVGFRIAIEEAQTLAAMNEITLKTAVVYGYGGVLGTVVNVLQSMDIQVMVTGRRSEEAEIRAKAFGLPPYDRKPKDLFINATPVTNLTINELLAIKDFVEAIKGSRVAFDHTMPGLALEHLCNEKGILHIPGTRMYWPQMIAQWKLFMAGHIAADRIEGLLREADQLVAHPAPLD